MIRVVLADDEAMIRSGLRMILADEPDIEVVGEATDGAAAVEEARWRRPDVVVMDVQMPGVDGLEATRRMATLDPAPHVLILTTFDLDEYVFEALRAGAAGFLLKSSTAEELVNAVRVIAAGDALLAPAVTRRVIAAARDRRPRPELRRRIEQLSVREIDVLRLIAQGLSNGEIATALIVGEATVKTHVSSILAKLGLRDRVAAVILAYEVGLTDGAHAPASPGSVTPER